jgi:hypothetical protein
MKRRSFWQSEPKTTKTAPPVRKPEPVSTSSRDAELKKAKRNSYWRPDASFEPERLLSESNADATDIKTKRSSRRLSLHRNPSSKSSRSRNSLRFSFLAGGADDSDDDDDVPAMPPIPVNLQRQKSRSKDPGRSLGVGGPQPGTAITSDNIYDTAAPNKRNSLKRRSLSKLMTNRRTTSDIQADDLSGNKRKRRSWFSINGSESSPDTAIPPMPALPNNSSNLPFPANLDPGEAAFHRFLHNVHNAAPKGAVATDFERFLDASRNFDASVPTPPNLSHRNSTTDLQSPRPGLSGLQKRSTIAVQPRSRASRCRPAKLNTTNLAQLSDSESPNEKREWSKFRHTMNDSASPDSSGEWEREDDDGVMGMLRELSRNEEHEAHQRAEKRRRDREIYLGVGTFENKDALAALEFDASR